MTVQATLAGEPEDRGTAPARAVTRPPGRTKALIGGTLVALVVIFVAASWLVPGDPNAQVLQDRLLPPLLFGGNATHLLGTDQLGRDALLRLMHGGRIDLAVGLLAIFLSTILGTFLGLYAAYFGKTLDAIMSVAVAVQLALPTILVVLLALAVIGPSIITMGIILALSDWVLYGRTVRARALTEMAREYVEAAHVLGYRDSRIIFRHLLPNIAPSIMVLATMSLGNMIMFQASLSFLGLGVQRPYPAWGRMVSEGQAYLSDGWWISGLPAVLIGMTVVGLNLLGDGLRQLWKMD